MKQEFITNDIQLIVRKGNIIEANNAALLEFGNNIVEQNLQAKKNILSSSTELEEGVFYPANFQIKNLNYSGWLAINNANEIWRLTKPLTTEDDRYRFLSEVALEAIALTENKIIIDCNKQFAEMHGYDSREEVIGLTIDDFVEKKHIKYVDTLLNQNEVNKVEVINKKKNGEPITVESKGLYMHYQGKRVRVSVMYDITKRKKIEKALQERERSMKTLLGHLPGMAYRCSLKRGFPMQFVSQGSKDLIGYTPEEVIEKQWFNKSIKPKFKKERNQILSKKVKHHYTIEYPIQDKNGNEKWVWEQGEIIFENKKAIAAEGFINDITNRKQYEQKLKETNKQFKNLVEHAPDGILIHSYGLVQYANPKILNILECESLDEIIGEDIYSLFTKYCPPVLKAKIIESLKESTEKYTEISYQNSKGKQIELGINSIKAIYKGSDAIQSTISDKTIEKKLYQQELRLNLSQELNKELKQEIERHIQTQKLLEETESYTRSIINSSLDMIIAIDNEGVITDFNAAAERTFGYQSSEVIGRHVNMLYDSNFDFINVRNSLKNTGEFHGEVVNKNKIGQSFTTLLSASLIRDSDGKQVGSMGISRDISKIKSVEQELKTSESRYRDLIENITEYIISVDIDGNFLFVNNSFKRAIGYTDQELKQLKLADLLTEERKKYSQQTIQYILSGKLASPIKTEMVTKHGRILQLRGNTSVKYKHYKPVSIRGIFTDITENIKVESMVKKQTAKMKSIFDSANNVLMWTMNVRHEITSMNEMFRKTILKYCELNIREGAIFYQELGPYIQKGYYQDLMLAKFIKAFDGSSVQFEVCMVDTYNQPVWFEVFINPIIEDDQPYIHEVACMAYIINDKKENEQQIRQALEEKDILLKEVHHRVKNNLQVISSILNLQSSLVTDQKTLEILKESQSRIRTMSFIHESLYRAKDFSEIDFAEYLINLSKNLVNSYSISHSVKLKLDVKKVSLNLDQAIPCGLIVNEVITNSLKYAFPEGDGIIELSVSENDQEITLSISDNGVGLPKDVQEKSQNSLGMQLIEALTDQLDGQMKIENNTGTKYLLTFRKQN